MYHAVYTPGPVINTLTYHCVASVSFCKWCFVASIFLLGHFMKVYKLCLCYTGVMYFQVYFQLSSVLEGLGSSGSHWWRCFLDLVLSIIHILQCSASSGELLHCADILMKRSVFSAKSFKSSKHGQLNETPQKWCITLCSLFSNSSLREVKKGQGSHLALFSSNGFSNNLKLIMKIIWYWCQSHSSFIPLQNSHYLKFS